MEVPSGGVTSLGWLLPLFQVTAGKQTIFCFHFPTESSTTISISTHQGLHPFIIDLREESYKKESNNQNHNVPPSATPARPKVDLDDPRPS